MAALCHIPFGSYSELLERLNNAHGHFVNLFHAFRIGHFIDRHLGYEWRVMHDGCILALGTTRRATAFAYKIRIGVAHGYALSLHPRTLVVRIIRRVRNNPGR